VLVAVKIECSDVTGIGSAFDSSARAGAMSAIDTQHAILRSRGGKPLLLDIGCFVEHYMPDLPLGFSLVHALS
jgi:hypothetical protein